MSRRRKAGKLQKLDRRKEAPRRSGLVLARTVDEAVRKSEAEPPAPIRMYRHGDYLVRWQMGRFTLTQVADPAQYRSYAKAPRGLRSRINQAIREGKTNG